MIIIATNKVIKSLVKIARDKLAMTSLTQVWKSETLAWNKAVRN